MLLLLEGEFATAAECNALQVFLNMVKRWGITSDDRSNTSELTDILDETDYGLFKKMHFPTIVCIISWQMSAVVYMVWKCVRVVIICSS